MPVVCCKPPGLLVSHFRDNDTIFTSLEWGGWLHGLSALYLYRASVNGKSFHDVNIFHFKIYLFYFDKILHENIFNSWI